MENNFDTVAGEMFAPETPADDAQAAISAEELMHGLTGEDGEQTAENDGASDQDAKSEPERNEQSDKFSKRMRAALANQKRQLYAELGGSEEEIREIIRAHKAQKLSQENKNISPEAARMIVEEREKAQSAQPATNADTVAAIQGLIEDGWTREMLTDFVRDETVREQINEDGVSVRRAAFAYLQRQRQTQEKPAAKKSVPTLRTATAAGASNGGGIEDMTDEEFAAFDRRVRNAAASGRKVRF